MHLLQHFHQLSIRPENAKELRGLILQLAVQGKLTAEWRKENPDVEPASELLECIRENKSRLVTEKKIKKEKTLPKIRAEEEPYKLPHKWMWCRLGNLAHYGAYSKKESSEVDGNTWVLELEDIEKETSRLLQKTLFEERQFKSTKNAFEKGDVLYGKLRPYLDKVIVADENGVCSTEIMPIKIYCQMSAEYLRWVLKSPKFMEYVNSSTHGMRMPRLGTDKAKLAVIPLPPLPEQHAIVQIVNTLLQEVEQLEQLTEQRLQLKKNYAASALHHLVTAPAPDAWAALQPHFHTFFNEIPNIQKLRAAILQLAVQGKLTAAWRRENPEVEPAGVLLERIGEEKARLIKEKKIKKEKALPKIKAGEIPYEVPEGWEWCRLGDATHYGAYSKMEPSEIGKNIWVLELEDIEKETSRLLQKVRFQERRSKSTKNAFEKGDVLYGKLRPYLDKVIVADENGVCSTEIMPIKTYIQMSGQYLKWYLKSPKFIEYVNQSTHGMRMPRLGTDNAKRALISLPPPHEQRVIVQIVDNLMNLCNQLEKNIIQNQTQSEHLLQSALKEVSAPPKIQV